ncbi:MAG: GIY-YIG nuclease family protein [Cyclobacteriaceae bacterium]
MVRGGSVYILTNKHHTVFYTGVTSDLLNRMIDHRDKRYPKSFSAKYNAFKLVYFENFHSIEEAIEREKQIKKYRREKKVLLIESINAGWKDLFNEIE